MAILLFIGPEGHRNNKEGGSGYNPKKDVVKLGPDATEIAKAANPLFDAAQKDPKKDKVIFSQLSTLSPTPNSLPNSPEAQKIQARYQAELEKSLREAAEKDKRQPKSFKPKK